MALSIFVFGAAFLTLRRRPWTPRLTSWIAVGISATTAGILLGVAADKMFYESYGIGGWLGWGALLAAAIASPLLCANALMSGRPLPTFLELLGPRDAKARRSEEHTSELQSHLNLVCRLLLEKKKFQSLMTANNTSGATRGDSLHP